MPTTQRTIVIPETDYLEEIPLEILITEHEKRPASAEKKIRIFIMSPGHHSSHSKGWKQCFKALMEIGIPGYEFIHGQVSGCGVAKARNVMMAHAVFMDVDAVLCWDSDISLPGKTKEEWLASLLRLLSHPKELGNISALYAAKTEENGRWIMTPLVGERRRQDGLLKVQEAGTGLKLIWMWQIQMLIRAHEEISYTPDDTNHRQTMWDFFSMGVVNGRYLSEDYYFDYRLRKLGYDVWVDTGICTRHRGETADGRVVDFPVSPIPLPGLPFETPPDAGKWPLYFGYSPFVDAWCKKDKIDLQGWNSTAPIFKELIGQINPTVIIEVGTWKGASALHMASLCEATIYCCDTWLGGIDHALGSSEHDQTPRDGYGVLYHTFAANVTYSGYRDRIIPIPQPSINAARWLQAKNVQAPLIYIDASHEYVDVIQDLTAFWKLLTPGGAMFGDDFNDANNPGVARAVKWFASRHNLPLQLTQTGHWYFLKPIPASTPQ